MCAPCKPIINCGAAQAAERADMLAKTLQVMIDRGDRPSTEGRPSVRDRGEAADILYAQALADIEYIEAVRANGAAMAREAGASLRWVALMERL